jgi:hypothetical protein
MGTTGQFAAVKGIPLSTRVMFAAQDRADSTGRAEFEPGELRRLTGLGENSRTQVNDAIKRLVASGLIAAGASSRVIVLNPALRVSR